MPVPARRGSSRRWSSPSPRCTSCARRSWTASTASPAPAQRASDGVRAWTSSDPPDRFMVGLAVLSCWPASRKTSPWYAWSMTPSGSTGLGQVLAFVARRLLADRVALVFAIREPGDDASSRAAELLVTGLRDGDARALLDSVITGPVEESVPGPPRRRVARQPAGAAGALPRADTSGRHVRDRAGRGDAAGQPHRGGLRPPASPARPRPGGCCSRPQPSRSGMSPSCGAQPGGSGSGPMRRSRPRRPD